jgi:hypothetical protein
VARYPLGQSVVTFVINHIAGGYVSDRPGKRSYTATLKFARRYATREEAEADRKLAGDPPYEAIVPYPAAKGL